MTLFLSRDYTSSPLVPTRIRSPTNSVVTASPTAACQHLKGSWREIIRLLDWPQAMIDRGTQFAKKYHYYHARDRGERDSP